MELLIGQVLMNVTDILICKGMEQMFNNSVYKRLTFTGSSKDMPDSEATDHDAKDKAPESKPKPTPLPKPVKAAEKSLEKQLANGGAGDVPEVTTKDDSKVPESETSVSTA